MARWVLPLVCAVLLLASDCEAKVRLVVPLSSDSQRLSQLH